jgi:molybdenum cofactor biosynthesis enzyme
MAGSSSVGTACFHERSSFVTALNNTWKVVQRKQFAAGNVIDKTRITGIWNLQQWFRKSLISIIEV